MKFLDFWFALYGSVHSLFIHANLKCFTEILLGTTLLNFLPLIAGDQAISHSHRLQRGPLLIPLSRLPCDFMLNVREPEIRLLPPWENQKAKGS